VLKNGLLIEVITGTKRCQEETTWRGVAETLTGHSLGLAPLERYCFARRQLSPWVSYCGQRSRVSYCKLAFGQGERALPDPRNALTSADIPELLSGADPKNSFRQLVATSSLLLNYLSYNAGAYGAAAFADSETYARLHSNGCNQFDCHGDVVTGHYHLYAFG